MGNRWIQKFKLGHYQILVADGRSWGNLVKGGAGWCLSPTHQSVSGWRVTPLARSFLLSLEAKTELKGRYSFRRSQISSARARTLALDANRVAVQNELANNEPLTPLERT